MRKLFALLSLALVLGGCLPQSEDAAMEEKTPADTEETAETPAATDETTTEEAAE